MARCATEMIPFALSLAFAGVAFAQGGPPGAGAAPDPAAEARVLSGHVQLTSRDQFLKAGEAYFSPDGAWIIFQATPAPAAGEPGEDHYSMYVAKVVREGGEGGAITGIEAPLLISPPGSANTCGWFHPTKPAEVLYGSTLLPPNTEDAPGYQRDSGRYKWAFPSEMEIVTQRVPALEGRDEPLPSPTTLFTRAAYDAEGSWSRDGSSVLYAHVELARSEPGRPDADIYIYDLAGGEHVKLVEAPGYDGGPFFSPDEKWIIYRSDRRGDNMLQLFASELRRDEDGRIVGIKREAQLTDNEHVNWAPFFHPSGEFLVYGTSEMGHFNYEVFAIEWDPSKGPEELKRVQITSTGGADVLPVFSPDGAWMMWTAQRGELAEGEQRPSSQLWAARFDVGAVFGGGRRESRE
jgi:TolB protein